MLEDRAEAVSKPVIILQASSHPNEMYYLFNLHQTLSVSVCTDRLPTQITKRMTASRFSVSAYSVFVV